MTLLLQAILKNRLGQVIGLVVSWCLFLLIIRIERSGSTYYKFLAWNLFLAAVPLAASSAMLRLAARNASRLAQLGCFAFWLIFFPNAPYVLTDLVHLTPRPPVPMWYDLALILSCGGTGLVFGYLSMIQVHGIMARRFGEKIGWSIAISSLLLSGFGIYLGRFLRLNSWDIARKPESILIGIADVVRNPGFASPQIGVTVIFGVILAFWYVAMRQLTIQVSSTPSGRQRDERAARGMERHVI